jgi:UDP-N-acetyl-D-glucosamine dehydrogenase
MRSVGVVGLGYVGLPLAVQAAQKGYRVVGIDMNTDLIGMVNDRVSPFLNDDRFEIALKSLKEADLRATTDFKELSEVDSIVICVPTPTENGAPDLSYVMKAVGGVAGNLRSGQLVCLESTVNPGVTRDEILPVLEEVSSMKVGKDFFLAHCPERIDPGNPKLHVGNLNRVVGGITPACSEKAADFYKTVIDADIMQLASAEEAEFVKSWENSHRNVMIALANSAAIICDAVGMDIDNVLMGLQSKIDQFGLSLASPGIGPGGHCIPEDIHYVIKKARQNGIDTRFLDDAAELNDKMPRYAVQRLADMAKENGEELKGLQVALLGMAYKPNIADIRRSPAIEVGYELLRRAKSVTIHDPYAKLTATTVRGATLAKTIEEALKSADAVFIGAGHDEYVRQLDAKLLSKHGIRYVLDGRNCLKGKAFDEGTYYRGIGR